VTNPVIDTKKRQPPDETPATTTEACFSPSDDNIITTHTFSAEHLFALYITLSRHDAL
jgi:hypothetical protein